MSNKYYFLLLPRYIRDRAERERQPVVIQPYLLFNRLNSLTDLVILPINAWMNKLKKFICKRI